MGNQEVAFFTCVNDEAIYSTCVAHIRRLRLPAGFSMRFVAIKNANSLTYAYNIAMRSEGARYKVYLHQDVFIVDLDFILRTLNVFMGYPEVGLIGVCGAVTLPESGVWWESYRKVGKVLEYRPPVFHLLDFGDAAEPFSEVAAVDGLLMITQYDFPWDERIAGFHFYDISQSLRFRSCGYKVAVLPALHGSPVVHACGNEFDGYAYERSRQTFLELYGEELKKVG